MLLALVLATTAPAEAATFATDRATASTAGASCKKKAHVEITDDMILVECKKSGYARKLTELQNLRWSVQSGVGMMSAEESSGDSFVVSVKKKEFKMLKEALLTNLQSSPASDE